MLNISLKDYEGKHGFNTYTEHVVNLSTERDRDYENKSTHTVLKKKYFWFATELFEKYCNRDIVQQNSHPINPEFIFLKKGKKKNIINWLTDKFN